MKCFEHITKLLEKIPQGNQYCFRGQSRASDALIPSIARSKFFDYGYDSVKNREKASLEDFRRQSAMYIKNSPKNDLECLALMQHFGCSTRLLDFTLNPLVAIFFACESEFKSDGSVFIINKNDFASKNYPQDVLSHNNYLYYEPIHSNYRISLQSSCFLSFPNPLIPMGDNFHRITIDCKYKDPILQELRKLGISYSTIFPDISGVSKDINIKLHNALFEDSV